MYNAKFEVPMQVDDEMYLNEIFGTSRLSLEKNSSIRFEGEVSLEPDVSFSGYCRLGTGTKISRGSVLTNTTLGKRNDVRSYSILSNLTAGEDNIFGPFCFVRDNCIVENNCIIGAHVEATRSNFLSFVKVSHRAFIGDAKLGERTIVGAGVVFCNFDGVQRQAIKVGSNVILGSGTMLVAPLTIGDCAIIAAGSTVTKNVEKNMKMIQRRC